MTHDDIARSGRAHSTAAYVIAILALVLSMAGAATAGGLITGKQIKNNSVTSKDIKNGTLHLKDINGKSRPFAPPPKGMTIVGGGIMQGMAPSNSLYLRNYSPLPFTTKVPLSYSGGRNIYFGAPTTVAAGGESNTSKCSGSATNPTADVGVLCVYVIDTVTNVNPNETYLFPGVSANSDGAESNGFYVGSNLGNAGEVRLQYVWAYTAP